MITLFKILGYMTLYVLACFLGAMFSPDVFNIWVFGGVIYPLFKL